MKTSQNKSDIAGGGIAIIFNKDQWFIKESETVHQDIMVLEVSPVIDKSPIANRRYERYLW